MAASSRRRRAAEAACFVGLGLLALWALARTPTSGVDSGDDEHRLSAQARDSLEVEQDAAQTSPQARPYVRRLVIEEPPPPGGARRPARPPETATGLAETGSTSLAALLATGNTGDYFGGRGSVALVSSGGPAAAPSPAAPGSGAPSRKSDDKASAAAAADAAGLQMGKAAGVLAATRNLKSASAAAAGFGQLTPQAVATSLMRGIEEDRKLEADLRGALANLGPGASLEAKRRVVAAALRSHGRGADDEDVAAALSLAAAPPRPAPSPAALSAAVNDIASHLPDAATTADILQHLDDPRPIPTGPPPKGAAEAYLKYQDVFKQALTDYGVAPEHILGILSVESSFGANTGNKQVVAVLVVRAQQGSKQSNSDLQALPVLAANGDLGRASPRTCSARTPGLTGPRSSSRRASLLTDARPTGKAPISTSSPTRSCPWPTTSSSTATARAWPSRSSATTTRRTT